MADTTLFKTILCPVDFSDHSRQALAYAALLASRSKGRLVVIFVEDPMLVAAAAVAYDEKTLIDKARKELRRLVESTIAPLWTPIENVTLDVAVGQPHEEIALDGRTPEVRCHRHGRAWTHRHEQTDAGLDDASHTAPLSPARSRNAAGRRARPRTGEELARQDGDCARRPRRPRSRRRARRSGRRTRAGHPARARSRRGANHESAVAGSRRGPPEPSTQRRPSRGSHSSRTS